MKMIEHEMKIVFVFLSCPRKRVLEKTARYKSWQTCQLHSWVDYTHCRPGPGLLSPLPYPSSLAEVKL